jgi:hypothetical protein
MQLDATGGLHHTTTLGVLQGQWSVSCLHADCLRPERWLRPLVALAQLHVPMQAVSYVTPVSSTVEQSVLVSPAEHSLRADTSSQCSGRVVSLHVHRPPAGFACAAGAVLD